MTIVSLGEVCSQVRQSVKAGDRSDLRYLGLESIEAGTGLLAEGTLTKTPEAPLANSFRFDATHVLYGKLRPYLNKVHAPDFEGKCSTEIIPLLPGKMLDRSYLTYFLRSVHVVDAISARTAGSRMPRADMQFVLSLRLPLPSMTRQREVVDLLERAEGILRLQRDAARISSLLLPAFFEESFSRVSTCVDVQSACVLGDIAKVVSGVTKGRDFGSKDTVEVPYLRVANVQAGHLDLKEVKTIAVLPREVSQLALEAGDVLMTEGGDFDKLGRGALWEHDIPHCIHQNHVFRVRLDRAKALPEFFVTYLQSHQAKQYFIRCAKRTTNLASINMTQLKALPLILPSIQSQQEFAEKFDAVRSVQSLQVAAIQKARGVFNALLWRFFSV